MSTEARREINPFQKGSVELHPGALDILETAATVFTANDYENELSELKNLRALRQKNADFAPNPEGTWLNIQKKKLIELQTHPLRPSLLTPEQRKDIQRKSEQSSRQVLDTFESSHLESALGTSVFQQKLRILWVKLQNVPQDSYSGIIEQWMRETEQEAEKTIRLRQEYMRELQYCLSH